MYNVSVGTKIIPVPQNACCGTLETCICTANFILLLSSAIILRNIAPHTVVESIMTALSPYASLAVNNIRLIKDKQTQQNRGFAFVQLSSAMVRASLMHWGETACSGICVAKAFRAFQLSKGLPQFPEDASEPFIINSAVWKEGGRMLCAHGKAIFVAECSSEVKASFVLGS